MSYWSQAKTVLRTRVVDIQSVAEASVELLDEGGFRRLTVRAVASRLGVAPASLYSRVAAADDLFDLALDHALGDDPRMQPQLAATDVEEILVELYRHLLRHNWACQVIAMRPPRGPNYLRLSERFCVLLDRAGAKDPLGTAYTLSNFVIGSAATASVTASETTQPIDSNVAPKYAELHRHHDTDSECLVRSGIAALLASASSS